ncbi:hypothetical protein CYMTET_52451 [Cymbomonas tetramitiformis]|uniref:Uncharacterized protein n=1 Tax=Cymbomonas tetramitiformis TaxID=36881 RepID=A0AAE0BJ00_9CHLO|nr:hypothetical protein CYMTET_52451 [Cymbomonas tetramitiformis]
MAPAFLQPMVQRLPADFTLEFGAPTTWRANYKVFGEDDTDVAEEYTPPPFKKTKSAASTPTGTPIELFATRRATYAVDLGSPAHGAASAGPSVVAPAEPILPQEPNHIVVAAVQLKENAVKQKPARKAPVPK